MNNISSLFNKEAYLEKFTVHKSQTLFELEAKDIVEAMKQKRCLLCGNKLKFPLKGKYAMCTSKKHAKPFLVLKEKLEKYHE